MFRMKNNETDINYNGFEKDKCFSVNQVTIKTT